VIDSATSTPRVCKHALAFVLCVLLILATRPEPAGACTCRSMPTLVEARDRAQVAFRGRVLSKKSPSPYYLRRSPTDSVLVQSGGQRDRYVLLVDAAWKGSLAETLVVFSNSSSASCGYQMEVGGEYVLFAFRAPRAPEASESSMFAGGLPTEPWLGVGLCGGNRRLHLGGVDLAPLGEPIWRRPPSSDSKEFLKDSLRGPATPP